jgi:type IV pilus assembly protein PilC
LRNGEIAGFKVVVHAMIDDIRRRAALGRHGALPQGVLDDLRVDGARGRSLRSAGGDLDPTRGVLEASQKLKRDIKSAMTYPVISLCLVFGITAFLMIGIVPKFKEIFDGLGVPLPASRRLSWECRSSFADDVVLALGAVGLCVAAFLFWKRTPRGTRVMDRLILTVPVFGPLFRKVALSRFARTFSTLIRSGVPIVAALEIVETSGNTVILEAVTRASESVKTGESLAAPS